MKVRRAILLAATVQLIFTVGATYTTVVPQRWSLLGGVVGGFLVAFLIEDDRWEDRTVYGAVAGGSAALLYVLVLVGYNAVAAIHDGTIFAPLLIVTIESVAAAVLVPIMTMEGILAAALAHVLDRLLAPVYQSRRG